MAKVCLIILIAILTFLISDGDCWRRRRRREPTIDPNKVVFRPVGRDKRSVEREKFTTIHEKDDCNQCLEIQPFCARSQKVEKKTLASNDFVMVVKLIEENLSAVKLREKMKFKVIEVVKSPTDNVTSGQTFTIKAQMATCPCLATLDPGFYVVTGQANDKNQLVLSNVLMEFED